VSKGINRRKFLKQTAAGAGLVILSGSASARAYAANEKLNTAVVGCGGQGRTHLGAAASENLVALCDVDDQRLAEAANRFPNAKTYNNYRRLYDAHKDLDAVFVATPDHSHFLAAMRAIALGAGVYVEKPLTYCIWEARTLAEFAREKKVATQMGNQGHCGEGIRRCCEYIWAGAVGNVLEAHAILGRNFGGSGGRPQSKPAPKGLHWDLWLGPAPYRDYHDGLHPFHWRSWRQFGTGTIGDMGCHNLDALFWALRIGQVKTFTVECINTKGDSDEMYPQDNVIRWDIPARGDMPPAKVFSYDHGGLKPEIMTETEKKYERQFGEFTLFVGEKGLIGSDARIIPEEKHKAFPSPEKTLPRAHGTPQEDLFHGVKNGTAPCSNFIDSAGPLTEFVLAGHLAMFAGVGKKLEWDVEKMRCTNVPEINQYVRRDYRKGWNL